MSIDARGFIRVRETREVNGTDNKSEMVCLFSGFGSFTLTICFSVDFQTAAALAEYDAEKNVEGVTLLKLT